MTRAFFLRSNSLATILRRFFFFFFFFFAHTCLGFQLDDHDEDITSLYEMTSSQQKNVTRSTAMKSLIEKIILLKRMESFEEELIEIRRQLHRRPELMHEEYFTSDFVKKKLEEYAIEFNAVGETGILARLALDGDNEKGKGKIAVLLRADMDALPLREEARVEFPSENVGAMHACGHDGHMAMLLGAAKILKGMVDRGEIPNDCAKDAVVYFAFQPAEEGGAGAKKMLESKAMREMLPVPATAFALHNWPYPETPSGTFGTRSGTIMAGAGTFEIIVKGRGGHAAVPHKNVDTIVCAANIVTGLQTIVSRKTSALDSVVITISTFNAGTVANVMPDEAILTGTLRSLQPKTFSWAMEELSKAANALGSAHGCVVDVSFASREVYPPTVNDARAANFAKEVAKIVFGAALDTVLDVDPVMPAEDFSFFANEYPSVMSWIGSYNKQIGAVHPLHSAKYYLDESILKDGAAMHAGYALAFLADANLRNATTFA